MRYRESIGKVDENFLMGNQDQTMESIANNLKSEIASSEYIGDMNGQYKVLLAKNYNNVYLVVDNTNLAGYFQLIPEGSDAVIQIAWVDGNYRGKSIFTSFLLFIKFQLHFSKIIIGKQMSDNMLNVINHIYNRYNTYWTDGNTEEPYSPDTVSNFTSRLQETPWKLVLETFSSNSQNIVERFNNPNNLLAGHYSHFLDDTNCD